MKKYNTRIDIKWKMRYNNSVATYNIPNRMEGKHMKRKELNYEQAVKLLTQGKAVECQLSSRTDNKEVVHNPERLKYLHNLSKEGMQECIIYSIQQENTKVSEKAISMNFDEAYNMVYSGETVYCKEDGKEEKITTVNELISIRRRFDLKGKTLVLYWHE